MLKGIFSGLSTGFSGSSSKVSTDSSKIDEILTRGVEEIFVRQSLETKLRSGKQLRIKFGIDPTGKNIHFGNAIVLWKLRAFQDLGHKVVLVVGDFTAKIGDPSDKLEKRPMLTDSDIAQNLVGYKKQLGKILDLSRTELVYNSRWLSKLSFAQVCELAETFSVQQMTNRRNFKERIESGVEVSLREFLYPLMQGYDSVAVRADVELGGFDQLFNLKAGRIIQKHYGMAEQDIMAGQMLLGTDGRKMSKSWGNVINILDTPDEMFGKTMSLRDDLIQSYFLLCTDAPVADVNAVGARLEGGENPRDVKLELGEKIVERYWGKEKAVRARAKFIETFSEKKIPDDIDSVAVNPGKPLVEILLEKGLVKSKTEWRRLVDEGAVTDATTGVAISEHGAVADINKTLKIGKRRFIKVTINS
jgi:tyrosyl-tRNA synthetase